MNKIKPLIIGWSKFWGENDIRCILGAADDEDLFKSFIMLSKQTYERNKSIAELFGVVITKVKCFPTDKGWMIVDKHTKHVLEKGLKESEVDIVCLKQNYIREK